LQSWRCPFQKTRWRCPCLNYWHHLWTSCQCPVRVLAPVLERALARKALPQTGLAVVCHHSVDGPLVSLAPQEPNEWLWNLSATSHSWRAEGLQNSALLRRLALARTQQLELVLVVESVASRLETLLCQSAQQYLARRPLR